MSFPLASTDWIIVINPSKASLSLSRPPSPLNTSPPSVADHKQIDTDALTESVLSATQGIVFRLLEYGIKVRAMPLNDPNGSFGLFVYAPDDVLIAEAHKSRVQDWYRGIGSTARTLKSPPPPPEISEITPSERLRLVYTLLTSPPYAGGMGITSDEEIVLQLGGRGGPVVDEIFALHDRAFAERIFKKGDRKIFLSAMDFSDLRSQYGEQVAYYFAFLQFYTLSLVPLTAIGAVIYYFLKPYSRIFTLVLLVYTALFQVLWKMRAAGLARQWASIAVSSADRPRPAHRPRPSRRRGTPLSPEAQAWRRTVTLLTISIPAVIALLFVAALMITAFLALELVVVEFYRGPLKPVVDLLPTVLYCLALPYMTTYYTRLSHTLTRIENHSSESSHTTSLTRKVFAFTALVCFLALGIVAFVIVPFEPVIEAWLVRKGWVPETGGAGTLGFNALRDRLFYYVATGQVVNFALEVLVPLGAGWMSKKKREEDNGKGISESEDDRVVLKQAKKELQLPQYDVYDDYAEMVTQFGFITLFSVCWPLAPLTCLLNNLVEIRADLFKITRLARRPIPHRADGIGPWSSNIAAVAWLASLCSPALTALYGSGTVPKDPAGVYPYVFGVGVVCEHAYVLFQSMLEGVLLGTPGRAVEAVPGSPVSAREGEDKSRMEKMVERVAGVGDVMEDVRGLLEKKVL
ncbi:calcium-activated chloride channel-domain-containing protein [Cladochytrium replicatum]|nr:calcium-activated chloride channel-domain-containing protein [Cladochytrium replicatum]